MNKLAGSILGLLSAVAMTVAASAQQPSKEDIAAKLNGVEARDIADSPIPGIYQVQVGSRVAYVSADGRFLMQGDLYDLSTSENLTESSRAHARVEMLSSVRPENMIVFAPEGRKAEHTITIFTDIDCGYCRQFHREILGLRLQAVLEPVERAHPPDQQA